MKSAQRCPACLPSDTVQIRREESTTFVAECLTPSLFDVLTSTSPGLIRYHNQASAHTDRSENIVISRKLIA